MSMESLSTTGGGMEHLIGPAREIPLASQEIQRLDNSIALTQETRSELPPMSEQTRERLSDANWSEEVLDAIGSEAEASLYEEAGLEARDVAGNPALVRTDIDYEHVDFFGRTNLDRMTQGLSPLDKDNRPIELHHIGQTHDAPLAELTRDEHRGPGNDNILHNKRQESEIDRNDFARERADHWKARAADIQARN